MMAGLLGEGWEDPQSAAIMALAGGLLKRDFGGGLLGANQAYGQAKQDAYKQKYMGMQMANLESEIDQRKAAMKRAEEESKFGMGLYTGQGLPGAMPGGSAAMGAPGAMGQAGGAPDLNTPMGRSWLGQLNGQQVLGLMKLGKLPAGAEKIWEVEKFGKDYKQGDFRIMSDGSQSMVPMVKEGLGYGPGGVSVLPGAAQSQQQLTLANELAKQAAGSAGRVNLRTNADGTQAPVPELTENPLMQRYLGGQGTPATPTQGGFPRVSPDQQRGADAESIRMIQSELQNPNLPPDQKAGLQREIARLQQAQAMPGFPAASMVRNPQGYGMTNDQQAAAAAAKVKAEADARAQSEREVGKVKKGDAATDMLTNISRARDLLQLDPTGSGSGAIVDKVLNFGGMTTRSGNVANSLESLSGWLTSNTPRMEGPQSDRDAENYKIMAGRVGDRTIPASARLDALREVEMIQQKYAGAVGTAPAAATEPKTPQKLDALPKTATKGMRVRDTESGAILTFNGLGWVKEK